MRPVRRHRRLNRCWRTMNWTSVLTMSSESTRNSWRNTPTFSSVVCGSVIALFLFRTVHLIESVVINQVFVQLLRQFWSQCYEEKQIIFVSDLVPGGTEGPSGMLICSENYITYKNFGDQPDIRCPIPRRRVTCSSPVVGFFKPWLYSLYFLDDLYTIHICAVYRTILMTLNEEWYLSAALPTKQRWIDRLIEHACSWYCVRVSFDVRMSCVSLWPLITLMSRMDFTLKKFVWCRNDPYFDVFQTMFFFLAQTEQGDIFKITLETDEDMVSWCLLCL